MCCACASLIPLLCMPTALKTHITEHTHYKNTLQQKHTPKTTHTCDHSACPPSMTLYPTPPIKHSPRPSPPLLPHLPTSHRQAGVHLCSGGCCVGDAACGGVQGGSGEGASTHKGGHVAEPLKHHRDALQIVSNDVMRDTIVTHNLCGLGVV